MQMEEFIRRRNIQHFRKLLAETTDEAERKVLQALLSQEKGLRSSPANSGNRDQPGMPLKEG
jgi:hypothetical protein